MVLIQVVGLAMQAYHWWVGGHEHCYAFPSRLAVEASDEVITSTILVYHKPTSVLFDPIYLFIYVYLFSTHLDMIYESMILLIRESTLLGDSLVVD